MTPTVTPTSQTGGIQASAVAGITVGIIAGIALLLIAMVIVFIVVWLVFRRRKAIKLEPALSFATKDYTDEANITDLDEMVD